MSEWVVSVTVSAPGEPAMVVNAAELSLTDLDPIVAHSGPGRFTVSIGLEGFLDNAITEAIVSVSRAIPQARIISVEGVTLDEYEARLALLPTPRESLAQQTASANPRHNERLLSALEALRDHHPASVSA